jgi:hypothetical protein
MAFLQRGEHADHPEHAPGHIDNARARTQGTARRPGHVSEAPHHLRDLVQCGALFIGAGQEALLGTIDQARIGGGAGVVIQPQPVERAGAEVLHQHVGAGDEVLGDGDPLRRFQVETDRLLAAIVHREIARARSLEAAGIVTADGFDADDLGTQPCKDMADHRPHHHMRELDDADALEGVWRAHDAILCA